MFRAISVNIAINLDDDDDPYLLWEVHGPDGELVDFALGGDDFMRMLPYTIESLVRLRALSEMVTIWPEQRREIIQNVLFRWAGVIEEEEGEPGGS